MDLLQVFYANFYQTLLPLTPYRTGNMLSGIKFSLGDDFIGVSIEAVNEDGYDYVVSVNEALNAKEDNRPLSKKERKNYHFIQRSIDQASHLTAEKVIWEGGQEFEIS